MKQIWNFIKICFSWVIHSGRRQKLYMAIAMRQHRRYLEGKNPDNTSAHYWFQKANSCART